MMHLYKKASTGKIEQWKCWNEGDTMFTEHGYTDGEKTRSAGKVCKPKNVGKANETTGEEQAAKEVAAKYKKKQDEGYFPTVDEAKTSLVVLPMLAHPFEKRGHNIIWPCAVQRKYDGIRCLASSSRDSSGKKIIKTDLSSRKGKLFPHLNHIREEIAKVLRSHPGVILDGELYSDELPFEKITGAVRRETLKPESAGDMEKIRYHVYDAVFLDEPDLGFMERFKRIQAMFGDRSNTSATGFVETLIAETEHRMKQIHGEFTSDGYEGIMLRNIEGSYALNKRSADLQKYKHFETDEYEIVNANEGEGNEAGCVVWVCKTKDGKEFKCRPKGCREKRRQLYKDHTVHIGKGLTVRYQELTEEGIPRFPVGLSIRDYES